MAFSILFIVLAALMLVLPRIVPAKSRAEAKSAGPPPPPIGQNTQIWHRIAAEADVAADGAAPTYRFGRFDFDFMPHGRMCDRFSGQCLSFDQILEGEAKSAANQSAQFRYEDVHGAFPITVDRAAIRGAYDGGEWSVDLTAAKMAAASTHDDTAWGKAANFIADALTIWPDTDAFGPEARHDLGRGGLLVKGGWQGGTWMPALRDLRGFSMLLGRESEAFAGAAPDCAPTQC